MGDVKTPSLRDVRKRVELAQAMKLTYKNSVEMAKWCGGEIRTTYKDGNVSAITIYFEDPQYGHVIVPIGFWLIKGVNGGFHSEGDAQFHKEYELYTPVE